MPEAAKCDHVHRFKVEVTGRRAQPTSDAGNVIIIHAFPLDVDIQDKLGKSTKDLSVLRSCVDHSAGASKLKRV